MKSEPKSVIVMNCDFDFVGSLFFTKLALSHK